MQKIISLLLINMNLLIANNLFSTQNDEVGCTIPFFNENNPCTTHEDNKKKMKKINKIKIKTKNTTNNFDNQKKMKKELTNILNDVKNYKEKNDDKTKRLLNELQALKKEFNQYKRQKKHEIKQINTKLTVTKKRLNYNKVKLKKVQKKLIKRKVVKKKTKLPAPKRIKIYNEPIPKDNSWIEIIVQDDIDIYQLALLYYGDRNKYIEIYKINKNIIGKNLKIQSGMALKIPMTSFFEEQPILLNTN